MIRSIVTFELRRQYIVRGVHEKAVVQPYVEGWTQIGSAGAGSVRVVFSFTAPKQHPVAWFFACTAVREGAPGTNSRASIEWSADGRNWLPVVQGEACNTRMGWDFTVEGEVRPLAPLDKIFLRVTADEAIVSVVLFGHLVVPHKVNPSIEIGHSWTEDGCRKEFIAPSGVTSYTIACDATPCAHVIRMTASSMVAIA